MLFRSLGSKEAEEAEQAIRRWLADPRSGEQPIATRALVELLRGRGRLDEARKVQEQFLARHLGRSVSLFRHPGLIADLWARSSRSAREKHFEDAASELREAFRMDPFPAGGEPPGYEFFQFLSPSDFIFTLSAAFPPAIGNGGKPGLSTLRESFLEDEMISRWIFHDLAALVRFARGRGIPVLLATYPPDRFTGKERSADTVIRRVADALKVPLADVASELGRRWNGRALEAFYVSEEKADQLNGEGNSLVAGILVEEMERLELLAGHR